MTTKTAARIAAITATVGIAGLPLVISAPAGAINKPDPGGNAYAEPERPPAVSDGELDLTQLGAGTLGGITATVAAYKAAARLRRPKQFSASSSAKTPIMH